MQQSPPEDPRRAGPHREQRHVRRVFVQAEEFCAARTHRRAGRDQTGPITTRFRWHWHSVTAIPSSTGSLGSRRKRPAPPRALGCPIPSSCGWPRAQQTNRHRRIRGSRHTFVTLPPDRRERFNCRMPARCSGVTHATERRATSPECPLCVLRLRSDRQFASGSTRVR
jgi:hypothetical protein